VTRHNRGIPRIAASVLHDGCVSTVSTILTSALVSGAVAIGFEVVAKPRLDARKERILTYFRSRQQFESNLQRLRVTSGLWSNYEYPSDISEESRKQLDGERERGFQRMDDVSKELVDDLGFYSLTYFGKNLPRLDTSIPALISRYVFAVRGILLSKRTPEAKAKAVYELTEPMHSSLFGGRWHLVKRAKAPFGLLEVLRKYESPDSSGSNQADNTGNESPPDGNPRPAAPTS